MPSCPRYAAIDIGSNTVKLTIVERTAEGEFAAIQDVGVTTRLGEGIRHRRLLETAMRRTMAALLQCVAECEVQGVGAIAAIGTSALRDACNRDEFVARAAQIGLSVDVVSGDEEARLSCLAVRSDPRWRAAPRLLVLDIGGGSTEVVVDEYARGDGLVRASLQLGAVRLTEAFLRSDPPTIRQLDDTRAFAEQALASVQLPREGVTPVGVGGTLTNTGAVYRAAAGLDPRIDLHGQVVPQTEIERQIALYAAMTIEQRRGVAGLDPARADIILAGAVILNRVLHATGLPAVAVSCRGLRWGVLYSRFGAGDA